MSDPHSFSPPPTYIHVLAARSHHAFFLCSPTPIACVFFCLAATVGPLLLSSCSTTAHCSISTPICQLAASMRRRACNRQPMKALQATDQCVSLLNAAKRCDVQEARSCGRTYWCWPDLRGKKERNEEAWMGMGMSCREAPYSSWFEAPSKGWWQSGLWLASVGQRRPFSVVGDPQATHIGVCAGGHRVGHTLGKGAAAQGGGAAGRVASALASRHPA